MESSAVKHKKIIRLKFRVADKNIFEAIKNGKKNIETRAASPKYRDIKTEDLLLLICGKDQFEKRIKHVEIFKGIPGMLKKYKARDISPLAFSVKDLKKMYYSFPHYKEKIKKFGLMVFVLKQKT